MSISTVQFREMLARTNRNKAREHLSPVESESDLQNDIESALKRLMWPYVRCRMDKATTFTVPGVPDFIIAAPNGKTIWIECKTRTGKTTMEQDGFGAWLKRNNHHYAVVRSMVEFLDQMPNA